MPILNPSCSIYHFLYPLLTWFSWCFGVNPVHAGEACDSGWAVREILFLEAAILEECEDADVAIVGLDHQFFDSTRPMNCFSSKTSAPTFCDYHDGGLRTAADAVLFTGDSEAVVSDRRTQKSRSQESWKKWRTEAKKAKPNRRSVVPHVLALLFPTIEGELPAAFVSQSQGREQCAFRSLHFVSPSFPSPLSRGRLSDRGHEIAAGLPSGCFRGVTSSKEQKNLISWLKDFLPKFLPWMNGFFN